MCHQSLSQCFVHTRQALYTELAQVIFLLALASRQMSNRHTELVATLLGSLDYKNSFLVAESSNESAGWGLSKRDEPTYALDRLFYVLDILSHGGPCVGRQRLASAPS